MAPRSFLSHTLAKEGQGLKTGRSLRALVLRLSFSLAVIGGILLFLDLEQLRETAAQLQPATLISASLGLAALTFLGGLRWWILLRASGYDHGPVWVARVRVIGSGLNVALPGGVAGDLATLFYVSQPPTRPMSHALATVMADRILGLLVTLLAVAAAAVASAHISGILGSLDLNWTLILLACAGLGFGGLGIAWLGRNLGGFPGRAFRAIFVALGVFRVFARQWSSVLAALVLGIALHVATVWLVWLIAQDLGSVSFVDVLAAVSLAFLGTLIPASLNGLGVRDIAFVAVLAQSGFTAEAAAVLSLSWFAISFVVLGGLGAIVAALTSVPERSVE